MPERFEEFKNILKNKYKVVKRTTIKVYYDYKFEQLIWHYLNDKGFKWILSNHNIIYSSFEEEVRKNWSKHKIEIYLEKNNK